MSKYIKVNKQRKLVKEAIHRVLNRRKDMILEMTNRPLRRDYSDLSKPHPERTHKPEYIRRKVVYGEFEVFFENAMYLKEGKEEQYPQTLNSRYVVELVRQNMSGHFDNMRIDPSYRHPKDPVARAIMVYMDDDVEFRLYEEPLILLDEMFRECGYFRATPDKVYLGDNTERKRSIQYEAYQYEYSNNITDFI